MKNNAPPFLVAIVGGSGSGKTWLAEKLQSVLGGQAARISLDDFYRDQSHLSEADRALLNFDHPDAIDWAGLKTVLKELLAGHVAELPCYDFKTHCREREVLALEPKPVVFVDGLWLLHHSSLRELFGLKIFIDCPVQTRLRRRIDRDLISRGRTRASVEKQFNETVEPMHREFVAPQKRWADVVMPYDLTEYDARQLAGKLAAKLGGVGSETVKR
ncbi:MAG: uridine kinase [Akkermansiaceae bacterium]|nr:uridine kinase [Verrucomicrobiales bacterium]